MALTHTELVKGLGAIADHMEEVAAELNEIDGKLGDGDLGVTMVRGGREVKAILPELPSDIGESLIKVARAFTRVSGSRYGTLVATGLLSAAKATRGRTEVPWSDISGLLREAFEAMKKRGKAELGNKTVLDPLDAAATATEGLDDPSALLDAAKKAVHGTMDRMRDMPAQIGRARIFGDESVGLDDLGMVALSEVLKGLG